MNSTVIIKLPHPYTHLERDPTVVLGGGNVEVELNYAIEGVLERYSLLFRKARASRKTAELYCDVDQINAFDIVIEIQHSDWIKQLVGVIPEHHRRDWVHHHFIMYVDSFGCLEVVAEDVVLRRSITTPPTG